jgi:Ca2+-binding RTX toxin-like protein
MPKAKNSIPASHPVLNSAGSTPPADAFPALGDDIILFPQSLAALGQPLPAATPAPSTSGGPVQALDPLPDLGLLIIGTEDAESLFGTEAGDGIHGLGGNDHIRGYGGNDFIDGGDGNDDLFGGAGDDEVYGGAGNDTLSGGAGVDRLAGGLGHDTYQIEVTADQVAELENEGHDEVIIESFNAAAYQLPENVEDFDYRGVDGIWAFGNDLNNIMGNSSESSVLFLGGAGDDLLLSGNAADTLVGGEGNDRLFAGGSPDDRTLGSGDWLLGEGGNDFLRGGPGNDMLVGGPGADFMDTSRQPGASGGNDVFRFNTGDYDLGATDTIFGFRAGDEIWLDGVSLDQVTFLDAGDNTLVGIDIGRGLHHWIEVINTEPEMVESQLFLI